MQTVVSPWFETFQLFVREIRENALIASPFITSQPLRLLSSGLNSAKLPEIDILTSLTVDNLLDGSTDALSLAVFRREVPTTTVRHLPGLHAKVYIADDRLAIVTSSNLTEAGLKHNYEFGVLLRDKEAVQSISSDIRAYAELGSEVTSFELEDLARISQDLQERQRGLLSSAKARLRREFQVRVEAAQETLRHLRAKPGESTTSIFSRTITYLLQHGPLSTRELHPLVQGIHPDLCDDSIDRVINGVHFGKRWKHMVRNAQQGLKRQGLIRFDGRKWCLV